MSEEGGADEHWMEEHKLKRRRINGIYRKRYKQFYGSRSHETQQQLDQLQQLQLQQQQQ